LHATWINMKQRCQNPKSTHYQNYGGRGIRVCERWDRDFLAFVADMGERPSQNHTLDRIENNGDYEPTNCRWATRAEQGRNKRNNHLVTYQGVTKPTSAWAEQMGISGTLLRKRLEIGWSSERALTQTVRQCGR